MTSITAFDETIEKTNLWLQQLEAVMGWAAVVRSEQRRDSAGAHGLPAELRELWLQPGL
jgi:hypothetical protein